MPIYSHKCSSGHSFDRYLPLVSYDTPQTCDCGAAARRVITVPTIITQPNIHYTSPIDGRPITSMAARMEDLARSNCVPYDPDCKQDYQRRITEGEKSLDRTVSETVDREIALMPARKREKLEAELHGGMTVEPTRITPPAKPITTQIK